MMNLERFNINFNNIEAQHVVENISYQDLCLLLGDPVRNGDFVGWSVRNEDNEELLIWSECEFRQYMKTKYTSQYSIRSWNVASYGGGILSQVLGDKSQY